jgi:2-oxoglutarate dehydrogenase complex dehydrogenase (E1) component-like enzyme
VGTGRTKKYGSVEFPFRRLKDIAGNKELHYSGRPEGASPAVGSAKISNQQQKELVKKAFKI